jgi:hypothetical protein
MEKPKEILNWNLASKVRFAGPLILTKMGKGAALGKMGELLGAKILQRAIGEPKDSYA